MKLTNRQEEILELIRAGFTSKEIGAKLNISFYTVQRHRKDLLLRVGARNTAELISKVTRDVEVISGGANAGKTAKLVVSMLEQGWSKWQIAERLNMRNADVDAVINQPKSNHA